MIFNLYYKNKNFQSFYNKKIIIFYKFRQNFCRTSSKICLHITKKGKNKVEYTIATEESKYILKYF